MVERVYLPWVHSSEAANAWLGGPMPDPIDPICHKLVFGESAAADLADTEIVFDLSPDHGVQLTDSVPNTFNMRVVSDRLRAVLAETGEPIEFYPAKIRDLKGRVTTAPYFIMNPIGSVDCMDRDQSDFDESSLVPGQVMTFRTLALDVDRIPEDRRIFRLASQKELVLVRKDLAYEIYRVHEHRGMIFQTLESFGSEFR